MKNEFKYKMGDIVIVDHGEPFCRSFARIKYTARIVGVARGQYQYEDRYLCECTDGFYPNSYYPFTTMVVNPEFIFSVLDQF